MEIWAIVVAAGSSTRFGRPKQFADLAGRPGPRLVAGGGPAGLRRRGRWCVPAGRRRRRASPGADAVVAGGADPLGLGPGRAGRRARRAEVIVVHDAARPLARPELWSAVIDAVERRRRRGHPRRAGDRHDQAGRPPTGRSRPLDRSQLVAVQTPQAFRAVGPARRPPAGWRRHRRRRPGRGGRGPGRASWPATPTT